MLIQSSHLILDACCIFNLMASGCFFPIVTVIPAQVVITQTVWEQELIN